MPCIALLRSGKTSMVCIRGKYLPSNTQYIPSLRRYYTFCRDEHPSVKYEQVLVDASSETSVSRTREDSSSLMLLLEMQFLVAAGDMLPPFLICRASSACCPAQDRSCSTFRWVWLRLYSDLPCASSVVQLQFSYSLSSTMSQ